MTARVDAVVLGAGLSGLVTSAVLHQAGRRVLCLEARSQVGGRALSVESAEGPVDLGATWFWPGERRLESLAARLAVPIFPQHLGGDALLEETAAVRRIRGNPIDVPSFRFGDGTQSLTRGLAATLPAGIVRCDSPVLAVSASADEVVVTTSGGENVSADAVIVAVPPATAVDRIDFAGLHPEVARVAARTAVWMGDVVKAVAVYDNAFWRDAGLAGAAVSYRGPFREVHDLTRADGATPALFGFAPAAQFTHGTAGQIERELVDQLVRLFGAQAARPVAVHVKDWSREPWTAPAARASPRSTEYFGHPLLGAANPSGRILWSSTETAEAYAGHLEGAVRAGIRAAETVLATDHRPAARAERGERR